MQVEHLGLGELEDFSISVEIAEVYGVVWCDAAFHMMTILCILLCLLNVRTTVTVATQPRRRSVLLLEKWRRLLRDLCFVYLESLLIELYLLVRYIGALCFAIGVTIWILLKKIGLTALNLHLSCMQCGHQ